MNYEDFKDEFVEAVKNQLSEQGRDVRVEVRETNKLNTEIIKTNPILSGTDKGKDVDNSDLDERMKYKEILTENLEIGYQYQKFPHEWELIDAIVELMLDVICSKRKTVRIAGDDKPVEVVKSQFLKLDMFHMVDDKQIAFNPAVELSYLKPEEQTNFLEAMEYAQASPSLSQAQRIKKLSQDGICTLEAMCAVMDEEKKPELDHVTLKNDVLRKYFPKNATPLEMEKQIIKLLDQWQRRKERDNCL